jgi:hypothetical protein
MFSLGVVKTHLGILTGTTDDAMLTGIADGVSARIENMISRKVVTQSVTERVDARGRDNLFLRHMPIVAVTEVKRRPDLRSSWETISSDDYEADSTVGRIWLKELTFYSGPLTAEVSYTTGYGAQDAATLPASLVNAALDYVAFCYRRSKAGLIMSSAADAAGSSVVVVPEPPRDIREAILSHRKVRGIHLR